MGQEFDHSVKYVSETDMFLWGERSQYPGYQCDEHSDQRVKSIQKAKLGTELEKAGGLGKVEGQMVSLIKSIKRLRKKLYPSDTQALENAIKCFLVGLMRSALSWYQNYRKIRNPLEPENITL